MNQRRENHLRAYLIGGCYSIRASDHLNAPGRKTQNR